MTEHKSYLWNYINAGCVYSVIDGEPFNVIKPKQYTYPVYLPIDVILQHGEGFVSFNEWLNILTGVYPLQFETDSLITLFSSDIPQEIVMNSTVTGFFISDLTPIPVFTKPQKSLPFPYIIGVGYNLKKLKFVHFSEKEKRMKMDQLYFTDIFIPLYFLDRKGNTYNIKPFFVGRFIKNTLEYRTRAITHHYAFSVAFRSPEMTDVAFVLAKEYPEIFSLQEV